MEAVLAPREGTNYWGYWKVEDVTGLVAAGKRRRNGMSFILTNGGLKRFMERFGTPTCCYCKAAIEDDGKIQPYGMYCPRAKRLKLWHYPCGWGALLEDVIVHGEANRTLAPMTVQL